MNETIEDVTSEMLEKAADADRWDCGVVSAQLFLRFFVIRIVEAHNRAIIVERNLSNDHILSLHDKIEAKDAEIAGLRKLVGELADALKKIDDMCEGDMCKYFDSNQHCAKCKYLNVCETGVAHNALIKAFVREVAK